MEVLKVSAKTGTKRLSKSVAVAVRKVAATGGGQVVLQAVGATAVHCAAKAIAAARGLLAPEGIDLKAVPAFCKVEGRDGGTITGFRFILSW